MVALAFWVACLSIDKVREAVGLSVGVASSFWGNEIGPVGEGVGCFVRDGVATGKWSGVAVAEGIVVCEGSRVSVGLVPVVLRVAIGTCLAAVVVMVGDCLLVQAARSRQANPISTMIVARFILGLPIFTCISKVYASPDKLSNH